MDLHPLHPDYCYPHCRDLLFYRHSKPIFLLKAALMQNADLSDEAEEYDATEEEIKQARKNFPHMKRYGEEDLI